MTTLLLRICLTCGCLLLPWGSLPAAVSGASTPGVVFAQAATHTVGVGETLSEIAQTYQVSRADLMRINGIQNADTIYVGQELLLPEPTAADLDPEPLPAVAGEAPLLPSASHTVQRAETLRLIADAYDVDIVELMRINYIDDADAIYVGQVLELPGPAGASDADGTVDGSPTDAADRDAADRDESEVGVDEGDAEPSADPTSLPSEDDISAVEEVEDALDSDAESESEPLEDPELRADLEPIERATTLNPTYTVEPGDTPNRIALRTGVSLEALLALNRMHDFDMLSAGQTLILPATFQELQVIGAPQNQEPAASAEEDANIHTVQSGETLNIIAQRYDVTVTALMTANLLRNPDMLSTGQALRIPQPTELASADAQTGEGQAGDDESANELAPLADAVPEVNLPRRGYYFYTVQPGDTTAKIALQFDSTPLAIKEYNGLPSEETVYLGLELEIPYGPPPLPGQRPRTPVSGTSFVVSLSRQQCWVMRGERVLYDWICSTGYGQWTTRMGSFAVQTRQEMAKSSAYSLDMPYWLGIYDVGSYENGIHGLPIRWDNGQKIWEGLIGRPATYGCAMLDDIEAEQLFNLAFLGMPVHILE